jgi:hypothetical protein
VFDGDIMTLVYRVGFHLRYYKNWFDYVPSCTSNFSQCGLLAGEAVQNFINWSINVPAPFTAEEARENNAEFLRGILEGFATDELSTILEDSKELIRLMADVQEGNVDSVYDFLESYKGIRELVLNTKLPSLENMAENFEAHKGTLLFKAATLSSCANEHHCGTIVGDMLKTLLN